MVPAAGIMSPMIVRSSTDLPLPEAPTTPSTSPRGRSRSTPSCSTWPPTRVTRPRTRTIGRASPRSEMEARVEDGEGGIEDDHKKDRLHDGEGRESTDTGGAALDAQPGMAADERDGRSEKRRLHQAERQRPAVDRLVQLTEEERRRDAEDRPGHHRAAQQRHDIGVEGEQRQGQDETEEPRQ